jgi:transcriptional regulator with XRE-family HTH domain
MNKTLGQAIRELREQHDLSLRELAKKVEGATAAHLSDIEMGRRFPSEDLLARLAGALDVPVEDLKKYDTRPPVEEIRRLAHADPAYGFALRTLVGKDISPEEILKLTKGKPERDKR